MKVESQKSRVLFIMHMPPPVHGAAMVGKYIHDSKIVNETFDCRFENMTLASCLEDIGKGGIKKLFNLRNQLNRFRVAIKEFQPDLVYVTPNAAGGAFYKDFVVVQYIKHCLKKYRKGDNYKIVVHYHNKGIANRQNRFFDNILYKVFFQQINVILLANTLRQEVKKYVEDSHVYICPNGIPETLDEEPSAVRKNTKPKILFLSNLIISKGVLILLDALKVLKDDGFAFCCDFVGGESYEMNSQMFLDEVSKRNLSDFVNYAGRKYGNEKKEYFQNADIFAFPSFYHNETFGLVNLEAMEYKLPIVSTDEGGIPDVVVHGENGLICEKQNALSLAKALKMLIEDENMRVRYGENGYKKFKSEFTLDCFEKNFTKCLQKIIFENTQKR